MIGSLNSGLSPATVMNTAVDAIKREFEPILQADHESTPVYEGGTASVQVGTLFSSAEEAINAFRRYHGALGRKLKRLHYRNINDDDRAHGCKGGKHERIVLVCRSGQTVCSGRIVIQRKSTSEYEVKEIISAHGQCVGQSAAPIRALSSLPTIQVAARSGSNDVLNAAVTQLKIKVSDSGLSRLKRQVFTNDDNDLDHQVKLLPKFATRLVTDNKAGVCMINTLGLDGDLKDEWISSRIAWSSGGLTTTREPARGIPGKQQLESFFFITPLADSLMAAVLPVRAADCAHFRRAPLKDRMCKIQLVGRLAGSLFTLAAGLLTSETLDGWMSFLSESSYSFLELNSS